ncbi:MAG: hypothetical protein QW304_04670 [Thermoproteota archaeon]
MGAKSVEIVGCVFRKCSLGLTPGNEDWLNDTCPKLVWRIMNVSIS